MLGEELRLLYVAMTRARDLLLLSGHLSKTKLEDLWSHNGELDAASLASDVRPLDAADAAFTELVQPDGPVKVLLAPGG